MAQETLNLRHLRAFCEVATQGGISAAADRIHLSQPAITQAIAKLEARLAAPLFVRSSQGMTLTEPGAVVLKRAQRALALIRVGSQRAARKQSRAKGKSRQAFDTLITATQLRALLAVEDHGNFSIAARSVGVSQPSLYRMARDLERVSELTLYAKTPQGIALTEAAETLAQFARLAFAELKQGFEELDEWRGIDSASIVVGTLPLARSSILPTALNEVTRVRPGVRISVIDGPYSDLLHGLRHGEIDFMIGALRDPVPIEDVIQETLFEDRLAVVGHAGHPLVGRVKVPAEDLAAYPWVVPRPGTPTRDYFDAFFRKAGLPPPQRIIESSSLVLVQGLLRGSDRLTMISAHQIRDGEKQGLIGRVAVDVGDKARPIGLTVRQDWEPTPAQTLVIDLLRQASRDLAAN